MCTDCERTNTSRQLGAATVSGAEGVSSDSASPGNGKIADSSVSAQAPGRSYFSFTYFLYFIVTISVCVFTESVFATEAAMHRRVPDCSRRVCDGGGRLSRGRGSCSECEGCVGGCNRGTSVCMLSRTCVRRLRERVELPQRVVDLCGRARRGDQALQRCWQLHVSAVRPFL